MRRVGADALLRALNMSLIYRHLQMGAATMSDESLQAQMRR
jgi:hypothetical protein